MAPANDLAWWLLGGAGLVFTLAGGIDIALAWYPWQPDSPEWVFGTVTASLDRLPLFSLGLVLGLAQGLARARRWTVRIVAVVMLVAGLGIIAAGLLYSTAVPEALDSVSNTLAATGLKKAIARTALQAVLYPLVLGWMAVKAWRYSGARTHG